MEDIVREPIELTELELASVAGGHLRIDKVSISIESEPFTKVSQTSLVDNSVNIQVN
jgi:hypothetical protein